jgi:hypothetical protein
MRKLLQGLLPFEDLDASQFEAFVLQFLAADISIAVIEPAAGETPAKAARYKLVSASLYGETGRGSQRGIDIRVVTENGAEWVFQCKHYQKTTFTPKMATDAAELAEKHYPAAARYFLVVSGEPTPKVRDAIEQRSRWQLWGGSELSVKFYNEVDRAQQIRILRQVFPQNSSGLINRLFPQHDDLLVDVAEFFNPWITETRLFHHRAPLVGRDKELQALHDFVDDTRLQVCILPASGGIGKTRLLRAFGDTFAAKHEGRKLFFVDPAAQPTVGSDRLRAAEAGELVVVQDDAHRTESLRPDMVATLFEKDGQLLLAARPHGIDALTAWLARAGVDPRRIKVLPALPALTMEQMVTLAKECLPPASRHLAEPLAHLSKGCALIVTVGAVLAVEDNIGPGQHLDSEAFQRAVFDRLETEGFANVAPAAEQGLLRQTLRLLAVLAPWSDQLLALDRVAGLLECSARQYQENFDRLRAAGLLNQTREGWRVVPDLFADHLVYQACYNEQGLLTTFARSLQKALVGAANGTVLRNLAEAEWQAQLQGRQIESLLDPFWQEVRKEFVAGNYYDRALLIKEWKKFAAYQPERSLELARLALASLPPSETPAQYLHSEIFTEGYTIAELPGLLEPIAIYHQAQRTAALDLLWELHERRDKVEEHARNDPLNTIGRVAKFQVRHPIDTSLDVVKWLVSKLDGPVAERFCDRPSPALAVILKPVFEHDIEDNYSTGNTVHMRSIPLNVRNTSPVRAATLAALRDKVIPRGETATLNALAVLTAATEMVRLRWQSAAPDALQDAWLPERRAALQIVESLIHPEQTGRVLFRIMRLLRPHAARDPQPLFLADCARALASVPDLPAVRLTRILVSDAWEEFFHDEPEELEQLPARQARPTVEARWQQLSDLVAQEYLAVNDSAESVLRAAELLANDYARVGMPAQFSQIFQSITRASPALGEACIDLLLSWPQSPLDHWWTSLIPEAMGAADQKLRQWTRQVLRADNTVRWRSLHFALRWRTKGQPDRVIIEEVEAWARRLNDVTLEEVLGHLRWRNLQDQQIDSAILRNLNLDGFSGENLTRLADTLGTLRDGDVTLPAEFIDRFVRELVRVRSLDSHEERPFLDMLAKARPKPFYEMLLARLSMAKDRRLEAPGFTPLPYNANYVLTELPQVPDYATLARQLFQSARAAEPRDRRDWLVLFQLAVLRVAPLGLDLLREGLAQATTLTDVEVIIDALQFEGSTVIFQEPQLVKGILRKLLVLVPAEFEKWRWELGNTASPRMRGYTNHQLDPEHRYYREEAAKAAAIHAQDAELAAFYREIVRYEDADAARQRRWGELEFSEWN